MSTSSTLRAAPRGQLPYVDDDGDIIGDSDTIIAHLIRKYRLTIDAGLTQAQRDTDHLVTRMLDDLYWVMSYSRWKDERFWPLFQQALLTQHPQTHRGRPAQGEGRTTPSAISIRASAATIRMPPCSAA